MFINSNSEIMLTNPRSKAQGEWAKYMEKTGKLTSWLRYTSSTRVFCSEFSLFGCESNERKIYKFACLRKIECKILKKYPIDHQWIWIDFFNWKQTKASFSYWFEIYRSTCLKKKNLKS